MGVHFKYFCAKFKRQGAKQTIQRIWELENTYLKAMKSFLQFIISTCFLLFASDFIPGLRSTTNSLEDIDVRNNPFVALVERMGADYRPILVGAVPSLVVVNGRRVEEAQATHPAASPPARHTHCSRRRPPSTTRLDCLDILAGSQAACIS